MQLFRLAGIPEAMVWCTSVHPPPLPESHIKVGQRGENIAADYLALRSYKILQRNIKTKAGEIDLIARRGDLIIFVEVKASTKHSEEFTPSIRVDKRKIERLKAASELWMEAEEQRGAELSGRIDVIEVCDGKVVEHFEDVAS